MAVRAFYDKPDSPAAIAARDESKPRPVLVKGARKPSPEPSQSFRPKEEMVLNVRELLQLAATALALAECRVHGDPDLSRFLKMGERAIADVGTMMTVHCSEGSVDELRSDVCATE